MDHRKELLLASAARLYSMGVDLEAARARLKELVEQGVGYDSDEMMQAYRDFKELEQQWTALELQHLELRAEILKAGKNRLPLSCEAYHIFMGQMSEIRYSSSISVARTFSP